MRDSTRYTCSKFDEHLVQVLRSIDANEIDHGLSHPDRRSHRRVDMGRCDRVDIHCLDLL